MDPVLFSEPSTKQQEAWAKIQAERQASAQSGTVDKAQAEAERRVNLSDAEKFLEDKLGRWEGGLSNGTKIDATLSASTCSTIV